MADRNYQSSPSSRRPYLPPGTIITETDQRSVYIGRLPESVTEADLRKLFGSCGEIRRCTVVKNMKSGSSKGVAFIEFADRSSVSPALALSGQVIKGSTISVVEKRTRSDREYGASQSAPYYRPPGPPPAMMPPSMMNPAMMMAAAAYWPMQAAMMRSMMMRGGAPMPGPGRYMRGMRRPAPPSYDQWGPPPTAAEMDHHPPTYEEEDDGLWAPPVCDVPAERWSRNEWSAPAEWGARGGRGPSRGGYHGARSQPAPAAVDHNASNGANASYDGQYGYPMSEGGRYW